MKKLGQMREGVGNQGKKNTERIIKKGKGRTDQACGRVMEIKARKKR